MEQGTKEFNDSAMEMFGGKPKQQTAVEWLVDYIKNLEKYPYKTIQELEKQAKEMEKQQIIEAFKRGTINEMNGIEEITSEGYYNETFKNK